MVDGAVTPADSCPPFHTGSLAEVHRALGDARLIERDRHAERRIHQLRIRARVTVKRDTAAIG